MVATLFHGIDTRFSKRRCGRDTVLAKTQPVDWADDARGSPRRSPQLSDVLG
jgi:hypothetical protein